MVLKRRLLDRSSAAWFENDVKMYGTQTIRATKGDTVQFENDVKMYGTQTDDASIPPASEFEIDVKMYGTQTPKFNSISV